MMPSLEREVDHFFSNFLRRTSLRDQLDVGDCSANAHSCLRGEKDARKMIARILPGCRDGEEIFIVSKQQSPERGGPAQQNFILRGACLILLARQDINTAGTQTIGNGRRDVHIHIDSQRHDQS